VKGKISDLTKLKLAIFAACGVSLSKAGFLLQVAQAATFEEIGVAKGPSRDTVVQALIELHFCEQERLAELLSTSKDLAVMLDCTTDSHRELLSIVFGGVHGEENHWVRPAAMIEIRGHTAVEQVSHLNKVVKRFGDMTQRQRNTPLPIYSFVSLTADNTGSNTGDRGVRGLLEEDRKKKWEEDGKPERFVPLTFQGCKDHIVNLASKEGERRLMTICEGWGRKGQVRGEKHISTVAVTHLLSRLRSNRFRRSFRDWCRERGVRGPAFERPSETRYLAGDVLCLHFAQTLGLILGFFEEYRRLLTKGDREHLLLLFEPGVLEAINVRALWAQCFLLPLMKEVAKLSSQKELEARLVLWKRRATALAYNPRALLALPLKGKRGPEVDLVQIHASILALDEKTLADRDEGEGEEGEEDEDEGEGDGEGSLASLPEEVPAGYELDFSRPPLTEGPPPRDPSCLLIFAAACSFLFVEERHKQEWEGEGLSFMLATSRAVERTFSHAKQVLQHNKETRALILEALVSLRDCSASELALSWKRFRDVGLVRRAKVALKDHPKGRDFDALARAKLDRENREAITKEQREKMRREKEREREREGEGELSRQGPKK
jgi:hypothetical protein